MPKSRFGVPHDEWATSIDSEPEDTAAIDEEIVSVAKTDSTGKDSLSTKKDSGQGIAKTDTMDIPQVQPEDTTIFFQDSLEQCR